MIQISSTLSINMFQVSKEQQVNSEITNLILAKRLNLQISPISQAKIGYR